MEKFMLLDANVGDVLYVRMNKTVIAVKIVKYICGSIGASSSDSSYVWLLIAGQGDNPQQKYIGKHNTEKYYRTIEDCINDKPIEKYFVDAKELAEKCGMEVTHEYSSIGYGYDGVWKFEWDGFMPKRVHVALSEFHLVNDADGWHYEVYKKSYERKPRKFYDTYEECIADNQVKVVAF